jgi:cytidylate kinase
MAIQKGVVMDGRDIGTVVLPDAELKIFMIADLEIRTERRFKELLQKGLKLDKEMIKQNLLERDHIDSTRSDSPLRKAPEARVLDNSFLNEKQQFELALSWVKETLAGKPNFEN